MGTFRILVPYCLSLAAIVSYEMPSFAGPAESKLSPKKRLVQSDMNSSLDEEALLLQELVKAANEEWKFRLKNFLGHEQQQDLYVASRRLLRAKFQVAMGKKDRIAAWKEHFEHMAFVERLAKSLLQN